MPSYVTPKKNTEFVFYGSVVSQADTDIMQANPTIAAGDFKVSTDGGSLSNLDTIPAVTPASSKMIKFTLSTDEMNGDNVTVVGSDAAGDEWQDLLVSIQTTAQQVDDLSTSTAVAALNDLSAAEVWASATRTLTQSGVSITSAVSGSKITIQRGDTLSAALTGIGSLSGYVSIDWTVKTARSDDDDDAILRIRLNQSGSDDGLLRLNGAEATTAANGSITIDDAGDGDITIALSAVETAKLTAPDDLYYDVQIITASAVSTLSVGDAATVADITQLTS